MIGTRETLPAAETSKASSNSGQNNAMTEDKTQTCRLNTLAPTTVRAAAKIIASVLASAWCLGCSATPVPVVPTDATEAGVAAAAEAAPELEFRQHRIVTDSGRTLRLVEWVTPGHADATKDRPVVLYVHGTPGGWSGARQLFAERELQRSARLLSLDRPGWGGSAEGGVEPSMVAQAEAVAACLKWAASERPAVLVGHSLGGPVIVRAAMDYPKLVRGLVVLAGSVDPDLEKTTWYQAIGRWRIVRWMLPDALRIADQEIIDLRAELEAMLPLWSGLDLPVVIVHGEGDGLVPVGNVDFMERVLTNAEVEVHRVRKRGHFVPWKEQALIADRIVRLIGRLATD